MRSGDIQTRPIRTYKIILEENMKPAVVATRIIVADHKAIVMYDNLSSMTVSTHLMDQDLKDIEGVKEVHLGND